MISKNRFSKFEIYNDPFPLIVFDNFLNKDEADSAVEIIKNNNFDELVNDGRKNIRKGTKNFNAIIKKKNILTEIYNFFNQKETYQELLLRLEEVSKMSKKKFIIKNKPQNFKNEFFEYKRSIHQNNILKRLLNFINKKIYKNDKDKNSLYFEINYSMAKKGYKLKLHKDKDNRLIVFLLYLNKLDEKGGSFEIYSENKLFGDAKNNTEYKLEKKFSPSPGKLITFLSNPVSYHNVDELIDPTTKRFFCYGGYTSLNNIVWEKKDVGQ